MEEGTHMMGRAYQDLLCNQRHDIRHGKTKLQGIETIALRGGIMLQVTRGILSLTVGARLKVNKPTSEGEDRRGARRSRDWHPAKKGHPAKDGMA